MLAPNPDYVDLSKPSVKGLCYALRHPEVWPKDFAYCWGDSEKCGMGLAHALWPVEIELAHSSLVGDALGISRRRASDIFRTWPGQDFPTPNELAYRIEKMTKQKQEILKCQ